MSVNTANSASLSEKRALVLFGSPHEDGHTAKLLDAFLAERPAAVRVDRVDAYREVVVPCTGCGLCERLDGCRFPDFDGIDRLLRAADYLIVATPVYNLTFPAPLKAIFDRTQRYFSARFSRGVRPPIERPKKAAMLLCAGSPSAEGADIIRRQLSMMFTVMNTFLCEESLWLSTDAGGPTEPALQAARASARRFFA